MMALLSTPSPYSSSYLQSSSSSIFQPIKLLNPFLLFNPKPPTRNNNRLGIRAATTLESANGAAAAVDKPISVSVSYGRQYFPLAAVVGQVHLFSSFF